MTIVRQALGLDIGGTGIKAAVVDLERGELVSERVRLSTPQPATPEAVLETVISIQRQLPLCRVVGCGFPGTFRHGKVIAAPNLDPSWIGRDVKAELRRGLDRKSVSVGNDADAAGLAEMRLGAGRRVAGTVVVVTLGTGIGTAVFRNGALLPGTELGHLELGGQEAELVASARARKDHNWSWERWSRNVGRYLTRLEYLLGVDLFIIGGGASKKGDKFLPHLEDVGCKVVVARMGNLAGIIGAALLVAEKR
ncbi:MAG: ROK family protein [Acidobacteriota bacterium]|nr:ROK family protein [Acidobacteriota bacterium]